MKRAFNERRLTERIVHYWRKAAAGRPMPEEKDIDPEALGSDWPHCFLLQMRDVEQIEQFNFTYLGEGILDAYKKTRLDTDNLFIIGPNAYHLAPQFQRVATTRRPMIEDSSFVADSGIKVFYRQCLLPLGTYDKVEGIFGAVLFGTEAEIPR